MLMCEIYTPESLCYTPERNTTLLINYTSVERKGGREEEGREGGREGEPGRPPRAPSPLPPHKDTGRRGPFINEPVGSSPASNYASALILGFLSLQNCEK